MCWVWGPGDEIIMPAYTYTASASVVQHVGATIVMVDSQKNNVEMDYEKLAAAITERTKVIVPVDLAGICADVDKIKEIVIRPEILAKFTPKNDIQKLIGRIVVSNDCAALVWRFSPRPRWQVRLRTSLHSHSMR